ncbi:MAG: hypothetical protein Q9223_007014 [Gallowayella weberi]
MLSEQTLNDLCDDAHEHLHTVMTWLIEQRNNLGTTKPLNEWKLLETLNLAEEISQRDESKHPPPYVRQALNACIDGRSRINSHYEERTSQIQDEAEAARERRKGEFHKELVQEIFDCMTRVWPDDAPLSGAPRNESSDTEPDTEELAFRDGVEKSTKQSDT